MLSRSAIEWRTSALSPVICEEYTHDQLLERAISTDDADRAAKILQRALGIESDEVANYGFPEPGRGTVSSVLASSAIGCGPRRVFLPELT